MNTLLQQVFYSPARVANRCFDDLLEVAQLPSGMHPKMATVLEDVFGPLERIGNEIGQEKRHKTNPQTWKDSSRNTLYLN